MNLSVVYSSDNHYAQHVGVSIVSLLENNKEFNKIHIYLIENDISFDNQHKLELICNNYERTIEFINFNQLSKKLNLNIGNSISLNAYARLFLPSLINKSVDKILYLDSDSIINGSLYDLWHIELGGYYVAGVLDTVGEHTKLKVNIDSNKPYINSGMLLINLNKWRKDNIEQKFTEFISLYNGKVFHHDQGIINGVLNDKFLLLHPKYNAMTTFFTMNRDEIMKYYKLSEYYSLKELNEAINDPVFIHYTPAFVNRPWIKGSKHPLASIYKEYLEMTPWKGTKLGRDQRGNIEKMVAYLYNYLPFNIANRICSYVFVRGSKNQIIRHNFK